MSALKKWLRKSTVTSTHVFPLSFGGLFRIIVSLELYIRVSNTLSFRSTISFFKSLTLLDKIFQSFLIVVSRLEIQRAFSSIAKIRNASQFSLSSLRRVACQPSIQSHSPFYFRSWFDFCWMTALGSNARVSFSHSYSPMLPEMLSMSFDGRIGIHFAFLLF